MKKLIIIATLVAAYFYLNHKPSATEIASKIQISDNIEFEGRVFDSDWSDSNVSVNGHVRRIDRHYNERFPIITYDYVLTSDDYNNPELVKVLHKGDGNYTWYSKSEVDGDINFYHLIPENELVQLNLDDIEESDDIELSGKISNNSKITSSTGAYVALRHSNHKFLLVSKVVVQ